MKRFKYNKILAEALDIMDFDSWDDTEDVFKNDIHSTLESIAQIIYYNSEPINITKDNISKFFHPSNTIGRPYSSTILKLWAEIDEQDIMIYPWGGYDMLIYFMNNDIKEFRINNLNLFYESLVPINGKDISSSNSWRYENFTLRLMLNNSISKIILGNNNYNGIFKRTSIYIESIKDDAFINISELKGNGGASGNQLLIDLSNLNDFNSISSESLSGKALPGGVSLKVKETISNNRKVHIIPARIYNYSMQDEKKWKTKTLDDMNIDIGKSKLENIFIDCSKYSNLNLSLTVDGRYNSIDDYFNYKIGQGGIDNNLLLYYSFASQEISQKLKSDDDFIESIKRKIAEKVFNEKLTVNREIGYTFYFYDKAAYDNTWDVQTYIGANGFVAFRWIRSSWQWARVDKTPKSAKDLLEGIWWTRSIM